MTSRSLEEKVSHFTLKQEILRKSFHLSVLSLAIGPIFLDLIVIKAFLLISLIIAFFIELYRWKNPSTWINFLTRVEERKGLATYPFTLLTWFLVALPADIWYPYVVLTLSTIPTLLGDAAAAIVGKVYGSHNLPFSRKKTIEGAIAGFACAVLLGLLVIQLGQVVDWSVVLIPAATFFLVDFLEDLPPWFSDNMLSALLSAVLLKMIYFS